MKGTHQKYISGYFQQSGSNPIFNFNIYVIVYRIDNENGKCGRNNNPRPPMGIQ
jgi:hypothetical protein